MTVTARPRVVIIGAGFGGLYAARALANEPVDVLLIDRRNYHLFTPLLYQVATCGLEPEEIAYPVRGIFRGKSNVRFLMAEVEAIDADAKRVTIRTDGFSYHEPYDYLVVAGGSVTNYFGKDEFGQHSFGLKELGEAVTLRNHILRLYERAVWMDDPAYREALTTLVVVGGGPTGLETAGALYELYRHVLGKEYDFLETVKPRIVLVEATDRLLLPFPEGLQQSALEQARSLGVEIILAEPVEAVESNHIRLRSGRVIPTCTLVWAAGVKASPLAHMLGVELKRGGRVPVKPTLEVVGRERVYAVGDMAYLENERGQPYPMLIPVAQQQGALAARNILRRIEGEAEETFRYFDRGIMATIGRSRAVAWIFNRIPLTGYPAWVAWLGLHLLVLMGFRNRLAVFLNWVWNYLTYDRSVRIILERDAGVLDEQDSETDDAPNRTPDAGIWSKSPPPATIEAVPVEADKARQAMSVNQTLLAKRDKKVRPTLEQYAPVWLVDEKPIPQDEAVRFNVVFQHHLYGWVNRRYRYDGFNDVLYYLGQTALAEDEALKVQEREPYIAALVANIPNAYGG